MSALAPILQAFFTDRLIAQRRASPNTISAYRDTFRLLLGFAQQQIGKTPAMLEVSDFDAPLIASFLNHLEEDRANRPRTRNLRLAAIHSLFRFAMLRLPDEAGVIQRVLAIPTKRYERTVVTFLTTEEVEALLSAPSRTTWTGRRDHALLLLGVQSGLRISELTGLRCTDVHLGTGAHVRCMGKGRKERVTPLTRQAVQVLREWLREYDGAGDAPLFPTRRGGPLSRDAVEFLLHKHATDARQRCPSLRTKSISPHVLRHTAAMRLLEAGVDTTTIALWLGHESAETTLIYLHAHLELKERALARTAPAGTKHGRYRPPDKLLAFLEAL